MGAGEDVGGEDVDGELNVEPVGIDVDSGSISTIEANVGPKDENPKSAGFHPKMTVAMMGMMGSEPLG